MVPPEQHPAFQAGYRGFHPDRITTLKEGHVKQPGYEACRLDIVMEEGRATPMRDGVKLYADVHRPAHTEKVPAILAWSPYGKGLAEVGSLNYNNMGPYRMGIPYEELSGYKSFEGPNPVEWCRRGYAVISPDARGIMNSEGNVYFWGPQQALDIYDTINWISEQSWCSGAVVMMGNSWLAISQINHAARHKHPALKAIAPWEGLNDMYRHEAYRGG